MEPPTTGSGIDPRNGGKPQIRKPNMTYQRDLFDTQMDLMDQLHDQGSPLFAEAGSEPTSTPTDMDTGKRFNLKALFQDGKLDRLILGDFGPVDDKPRTPATSCTADALICFPIDPEMCGPMGVANNLRCPVTDRFWSDPKFVRE